MKREVKFIDNSSVWIKCDFGLPLTYKPVLLCIKSNSGEHIEYVVASCIRGAGGEFNDKYSKWQKVDMLGRIEPILFHNLHPYAWISIPNADSYFDERVSEKFINETRDDNNADK